MPRKASAQDDSFCWIQRNNEPDAPSVLVKYHHVLLVKYPLTVLVKYPPDLLVKYFPDVLFKYLPSVLVKYPPVLLILPVPCMPEQVRVDFMQCSSV